MSKKAYEYQEDICTAIRTIILSELNEVLYDKTITCTIIDDSKKEEGCYTVSDGNVNFDAYSNLTSYRKDDQVLISIQQGDFDLQKTIIRKVAPKNSDNPVAYSPPLGTMLDMTGNFYTSTGKSFSLLANDPHPDGQIKEVWKWQADEETQNIIKNNSIYQTIGLKASFKTLLGTRDYDIRKGNYGLCLDVTHIIDGVEEHARFLLDSQLDMFGDPYNFLVYFNQSKKIDISGLGLITFMTLYLYQDNNFEYLNINSGKMERLPYTYRSLDGVLHKLKDNIFVDNIEIAFGLDTYKMEDNTFKIYTPNDLGYINPESIEAPTPFPEDYNTKTIYSLWCNKNDNGEYIGFSDGIKDTNYDEYEYLEKYKQQQKGLSLKSKLMDGDTIPPQTEALQLYADFTDLNTWYNKIYNYLNSELWAELNNYRSSLMSYVDIEIIDALLSDIVKWDNSIKALSPVGNYKDFMECLSTLGDFNQGDIDTENKAQLEIVKEYLSAWGKIYNVQVSNLGKEESDKEKVEDGPTLDVFGNILIPEALKQGDLWTLKTFYNNFYQDVDKLIYNSYTTPIENNVNVKATVEKYELILKDCLIKLNNYFNEILKIYDINRLQDLAETVKNRIELGTETSLKTIDEDYKNFVDENANRYCIYWYRYNRGNNEYSNHILSNNLNGTNWKLIATNLGLPVAVGEHKEDKDYLISLPEHNSYTAEMDISLQEEKFKAVLFFNHLPYFSEELVFTNQEKVVDFTTANQNGALYIENGKNASDSYQLYGADNHLINLADRIVPRQLVLHFSSEINGDEFLAGGQVFWYIPTNSTMLNWDSDQMMKKGFSQLSMTPDLNQNYNKVGYECFYKTIKSTEPDEEGKITFKAEENLFYYTIKDYYNITNTNNTIICILKKGSFIFQTECSIAFTSYGTTGTDYTLSITPFTKQSSIQFENGSCEPMLVQSEFYDYNNKPVIDGPVIGLEWAYNAGNELDIRSYNIYYKRSRQYDLYSLLDSSCYDDNGELIVTKDYYCCVPKDLPLGSNGEVPIGCQMEKIDYSIASRVTSDVKRVSGPNDRIYNAYYNILQGQVEWTKLGYDEDEGEDIEADETLKLTSFLPIPTSTGDYYIEGTSTVIYDAMGKNPSYYKEPYKIYDAKTHEEITDVHWVLEYYKRESNGLLTKQQISFEVEGGKTETYPIIYAGDLKVAEGASALSNYLPTITQKSYTELKEDGAEIKVGYFFNPLNMYVTATDDDNNLLDTMDYYCVAMCYRNYKDDNPTNQIIPPGTIDPGEQNKLAYYQTRGEFLWAQPILISQNRYPSSMLNKWDENLTIDEKNGTILSTMMGAGYKDKFNRFNGILMGDVRSEATLAHNLTGMGLYGFNKGAQSFAWDINGTGFIGKSGRGRIWFDGDNGAIFSDTYQYFKQDDELGNTGRTGMLIDIDDGLIQMYGQRKNSSTDIGYKTTQSEVRISVNAPYFEIKDEGGFVLDILGTFTEGRDYYYKNGATFEKVPDAELKYEVGKYYYWKDGATLMFIGAGAHNQKEVETDKIGYYLQSHNYQGLDSSVGNWQIVEDPNLNLISGYYERKIQREVDLSNKYNKYTEYFLTDDFEDGSIIMLPFEDFENNLDKIYTEYILDQGEGFDSSRIYYIKNADCSYSEIEVNKNIYEPNKYYYLTGEKGYILTSRPYDENEKYYISNLGNPITVTIDGTVREYEEDNVKNINSAFFLKSDLYIPNKYFIYLEDENRYERASKDYAYYMYSQGPNCKFYEFGLVDKFEEYPEVHNFEPTDIFNNLKTGDIVYIYNPGEKYDLISDLSYETIDYTNCYKYIDGEYVLIDYQFEDNYVDGTFYYLQGQEDVYVTASGDFDINRNYYILEDDGVTFTGIKLYSPNYFYKKIADDYQKVYIDKNSDNGGLNPYISYYDYMSEDEYSEIVLFTFNNYSQESVYELVIGNSTITWSINTDYYSNEDGIISLTEEEFYQGISEGKIYYPISYSLSSDIKPIEGKTYYQKIQKEEYYQINLVQINNFIINNYYIYTDLYMLDSNDLVSDRDYYNIVDENLYTFIKADLIINDYAPNIYYYKQAGKYQLVAENELFNASNLYYAYIETVNNNDGTYYYNIADTGINQSNIYFYENGKYYINSYYYVKTKDTVIDITKQYYIPSLQTGMKIDLLEGKIEGYNLYLHGKGTYAIGHYKNTEETEYSTKAGDFIIDTSVKDADGYPLVIGENFKVSWLGDLVARSGKIGGWLILDNQLMSNNGNVGMASININNSDSDAPVFWADPSYSPYGSDLKLKTDWSSNLDFYVTRQGKIKATRGTIGGWTITNTSLYAGNTYLNSNGTISGAYISGGTISGGKISGAHISGSSISGGNISGTTITGGTISGSTIYISGTKLTFNSLTHRSPQVNNKLGYIITGLSYRDGEYKITGVTQSNIVTFVGSTSFSITYIGYKNN